MLGHYADVYVFDCISELKNIITDQADRLYEWVQPDSLEDLCFYKNNSEWLITVAHEQLGFINATEKSEILRIREIEGIMNKRLTLRLKVT